MKKEKKGFTCKIVIQNRSRKTGIGQIQKRQKIQANKHYQANRVQRAKEKRGKSKTQKGSQDPEKQ